MIAIACALFGVLPSGLADPVTTDKADVIEVNHCYRLCDDGTVSHCYSQVIFWRQHETLGPFGPQIHLRVAKYVMMRDDTVTWREGCVTIKRDGKTVVVRSTITVETWTDVVLDPEILDRANLPEERRQGIVGL